MYITIDTTAKTLEELINEYDVAESNPSGQTLSLITERTNRQLSNPAVGFDLTGVTDDIRIDGLYPADMTNSPRLSAF
jgi:hypothetical protein